MNDRKHSTSRKANYYSQLLPKSFKFKFVQCSETSDCHMTEMEQLKSLLSKDIPDSFIKLYRVLAVSVDNIMSSLC